MTSTISLWLLILGLGLVTYAMRLSFIVFLGKRELTPNLQRALRLVPVAVLSAIIFPEVFLLQGNLSLLNPRLFAGLLAALVAWRSKNVLLTICVGMVALWVFQLFFH